jgi:hypothetical protein
MGRRYEQAQYSRRLVWADKEILMATEDEISAYNHPEFEDQLPRQSLLVYGELSNEMTVEKND